MIQVINPLKRKKTMKKYIFMAVAGMLALSSCSNDENEPIAQKVPQQMTFTAGFGDGATTRASLSGYSVTFDAPDYISIFSANNSNVQFTTTAGGASATFSGMATPGDPTYYAVYPYKDSYTFSAGVVSGVVIPHDQTAAAYSVCGWDPNAAIAYATTTGSSLQFHNACALLKVTNNTGEDATIMINKGGWGEGITGTFNLDTSTGALTCTSHYSEVDVYGVPNSKTIYIAVAPGTYVDFTASALTSMDIKRKEKSAVTFEKGKIYNLGNVSDWND